VTVHLHPGADLGLVTVLTAGALLAVHLRLRGELVLPASAVQLGGAALAFVRASGMGKSTLAALLCASGHGLVTDDVLRVDPADGPGRPGPPGRHGEQVAPEGAPARRHRSPHRRAHHRRRATRPPGTCACE